MTASRPDRKTDNWAFLWAAFAGSRSNRYVTALAEGSNNDLQVLLRHHAGQRVSDPSEVDGRAVVDRWIGRVQMLFIAWICDYVDDPRSRSETDALFALLDRKPLRAYYEDFYPVALPWLFRIHLEFGLNLQRPDQDSARGAFERFTVLFERFRGDDNLSAFLDFLDAFSYGSAEDPIDIRTVAASFRSPLRVTEAVQKRGGEASRLDRGIAGQVRFLAFCEDLDWLINACADMPVVQSAFWFAYGYWFKEFSTNVAATSSDAIDNIVSSYSSAAFGIEHVAEAKARAADLKAALQRLTDGRYATPLLDAMRRLSAGAPGSEADHIRRWLARFEGYALK